MKRQFNNEREENEMKTKTPAKITFRAGDTKKARGGLRINSSIKAGQKFIKTPNPDL